MIKCFSKLDFGTPARLISPQLCVWALLLSIQALGALQVFPTRIELSDKKRVAHISLRIDGEKPTQYRLSAIFYRMRPDGSVDIVNDAKDDERSAVKLLRFSPHQATLTPGVEQVVRVRLTGPRNLPEGEYRAHLHVEPMGEADESSGGVKKPEKINMRLEARIAVAIPVIYRHGKTQFTATLSNLNLTQTPDKKPAFSVDLASEGNAFAYGDMQVFFVPKGSEPQSVGIFRGVASFLPKRSVSFPLTVSADSALNREIASAPSVSKLSSGKLRLEFRKPQENGKDGALIAALETP